MTRLFARVMRRWAETRYGTSAVRLWVFANVLASSDERALKGLTGKRRGHRLTQPGKPERFTALWLPCAREWTLHEFGRRRGVLDSWTPARRQPIPFQAAAGAGR